MNTKVNKRKTSSKMPIYEKPMAIMKKKNVTALTKNQLALFKAFKAEEKRLADIENVKIEKRRIINLRADSIRLAVKLRQKHLLPEIKKYNGSSANIYSLKYTHRLLDKIGHALRQEDYLANMFPSNPRLKISMKEISNN